MRNINDIFVPKTKLRSVTFSQHNAQNFADASDLIGQAVSEIFIFVFYFILEVVRRGDRRGTVVHGPVCRYSTIM